MTQPGMAWRGSDSGTVRARPRRQKVKRHEPEVMTRGGFKPIGQTDECRKEAFLDDPITVENGVGYEMLPLIKCDCPRCRGEVGGPSPLGSGPGIQHVRIGPRRRRGR